MHLDRTFLREYPGKTIQKRRSTSRASQNSNIQYSIFIFRSQASCRKIALKSFFYISFRNDSQSGRQEDFHGMSYRGFEVYHLPHLIVGTELLEYSCPSCSKNVCWDFLHKHTFLTSVSGKLNSRLCRKFWSFTRRNSSLLVGFQRN